MHEWKTRQQIAGVDFAGVENATYTHVDQVESVSRYQHGRLQTRSTSAV